MPSAGNDPPASPTGEPDYRFTLANERTFLAWIRTSLGLLAGAIAVATVVPDFGFPGTRRILSVALALMGVLLAAGAVRRWQVVQTAMRRGADLPASRMPALLSIGLALLSAFLVLLLLISPARHETLG